MPIRLSKLTGWRGDTTSSIDPALSKIACSYVSFEIFAQDIAESFMMSGNKTRSIYSASVCTCELERECDDRVVVEFNSSLFARSPTAGDAADKRRLVNKGGGGGNGV
jgi:hypothetical protein